MFKTWVLLSSIKFFLLSPLMVTITCFLDGPFMVMLIWGFGLLFPLIIFLNVFGVFCLERWESFFYPQNFLSISTSLSSLGIGFGLTGVGLGQFVGFEGF